jgi:HEAT repeat protein
MELDRLIEELQVRDIGTRIRAAKALGWIGDKTVIPPLLEALKDPDEGVRYQASLSLKEITKKDFGTDYAMWKDFCGRLKS